MVALTNLEGASEGPWRAYEGTPVTSLHRDAAAALRPSPRRHKAGAQTHRPKEADEKKERRKTNRRRRRRQHPASGSGASSACAPQSAPPQREPWTAARSLADVRSSASKRGEPPVGVSQGHGPLTFDRRLPTHRPAFPFAVPQRRAGRHAELSVEAPALWALLPLVRPLVVVVNPCAAWLARELFFSFARTAYERASVCSAITSHACAANARPSTDCRCFLLTGVSFPHGDDRELRTQAKPPTSFASSRAYKAPSVVVVDAVLLLRGRDAEAKVHLKRMLKLGGPATC